MTSFTASSLFTLFVPIWKSSASMLVDTSTAKIISTPSVCIVVSSVIHWGLARAKRTRVEVRILMRIVRLDNLTLSDSGTPLRSSPLEKRRPGILAFRLPQMSRPHTMGKRIKKDGFLKLIAARVPLWSDQ